MTSSPLVVRTSFTTAQTATPIGKAAVERGIKKFVSVVTDYGPDSLTTSGYGRIAKIWRRGTPLAEARTIQEAARTDISLAPFGIQDGDRRWTFINRSLTSWTDNVSLVTPQGLRPVPIAETDDIQDVIGGRLIVLLNRAMESGGRTLPIGSIVAYSLEDIAANTNNHPFWFQLYVMKDRDFIERLIDRAKAANCSALQLTLDLQVLGQRHKDIRNGLTAPPKMTIANMINLATKPAWCMGMLGTKRRSFGNIVGHAKNVGDLSSLSSWTAEQFDPSLSWADVEWIKKRWGGKLILKGIMDVEDARLAASSGADALIVSNHGGRQLDGAQSSIEALPAIAEAVGSEIEVWMDGGIRSGQDVLKARALGARGVLIGRAFLYALGAYGEAGVTRALQILHKELDITMAFCGRTQIDEVDSSILLPGTF
jgi:L-lactate dehydrogenase (cytochrome)